MDHDFIPYHRIGRPYEPMNHFFGYRVRRIPSRALRIPFWDRVFYCYDGVYYRPFGGYYVVCRPPYWTYFERKLIVEAELARVRFGYYYYAAQRYDAIYQNNKIINEQYETIAQNNEIIAQQNAIIAQQNTVDEKGRLLATEAYKFAQGNRLVQSYAHANENYFYQDGVFYIVENGQYKVIIPPAGAQVEYIPEDYEMVTLSDGQEYFKVDDTVYKIVVEAGIPYFEVMGQLYE